MNHKRCLVIGASGDIGMAVVPILVKQGYGIAVHYHSNYEAIQQLRADVPKDQWLACIQADLSTGKGIEQCLSQLDREWDAIVFCGGQAWSGLFQDMPLSVIDKLYAVHVQATIRITQHCLPFMINNKHGNIVVVSSIFGEEGASLETVYSTVKGAQISFVKALAKETAPSGIRVNAVTPGFIHTKMNNHLDEEEYQAIEEDIPMGRSGEPSEVAEAIAFLISERSSYITGHTLKVNGGWG